MTTKLDNKNITLVTSILAYFSNSFIVNLPYVLGDTLYTDLQILPDKILFFNTLVLVIQSLGILTGALVFSFWADVKGRLFILFTSIFIYSLGTFLGGFVTNINTFLVLKFIVGFGLAPELGIGIVLISEIFPRSKNSLFVALIAIFGFSAVLILSISSKYFDWRNIYFVAGLGGLLIMLARFATFESDIFLKIKKDNDGLSSILNTLKSRKFYLLLFGLLPIYVITAGSTFLTSEIYQTYQVSVKKDSLAICFVLGAISGFILIPILTNYFKSRRLIFKICFFSLLLISVFTSFNGFLGEKGLNSVPYFYIIVVLYGLSSGYLFEFLIFAIEQFGTNKRGSATTLLFSLARSSVFLFTILIPNLNIYLFKNFLNTLLFIESIVFVFAIWAIFKLDETFNKDLNFID
ncbi:MFS transporter [Lacihabitans sp. LS3-19]|uniref:MFS transporter n=1 Tax=Lacihabitans sp. LS3-19 TaxID=2487335 RepID=UPI0020CB6FD6|nr:MFS transporter [Lacihabitans sp. LS3-19]MCP9766545.1 MFS transporter [Lacihabitans sp. LS3-19]